MSTPAEIAAEAARFAAEFTPEQIKYLRLVDWVGATGELEERAIDAIDALLADRERLRGLVAEHHSGGPVCIAAGSDGFLRWGRACSCSPRTHGVFDDRQFAAAAHADHVAAVLEGRES